MRRLFLVAVVLLTAEVTADAQYDMDHPYKKKSRSRPGYGYDADPRSRYDPFGPMFPRPGYPRYGVLPDPLERFRGPQWGDPWGRSHIPGLPQQFDPRFPGTLFDMPGSRSRRPSVFEELMEPSLPGRLIRPRIGDPDPFGPSRRPLDPFGTTPGPSLYGTMSPRFDPYGLSGRGGLLTSRPSVFDELYRLGIVRFPGAEERFLHDRPISPNKRPSRYRPDMLEREHTTPWARYRQATLPSLERKWQLVPSSAAATPQADGKPAPRPLAATPEVPGWLRKEYAIVVIALAALAGFFFSLRRARAAG